jgi:hypothetical protein
VDLQHYTAHLKEKVDAPVMDLGRMSLARRPALDLPAAAPGPSVHSRRAATGTDNTSDVDLDSATGFDVPAFLRREG